ncbi:hypothetical protein [Oceanobacillus sp. CAU 1775]
MKRFILLLLFTGLISACSNNEDITEHSYQFVGEGQYWKAELEYEATEIRIKDAYSSEDEYKFKLTYNGDLDEIASLKQLAYEFKLGSTGGGTSSMTFDEPLTVKEFKSAGSSEGGLIMTADMVVSVEVKWDDYEESFELVVNE